MAFPVSLTLIAVNVRADLLPGGGSTGWARLRYDGPPLTGPSADSIVAYVDETETFAADGTCTLQVPATNATGWTPQDFTYEVTVCSGSRVRRGTVQLDRGTTTVNLADVVQWDGVATTGTTYATLGQVAAVQSDLTDAQAQLALKAPLASPTFTGTVGGITKSMVGLGNADNTSDAAKPVSTAQLAAILQYHAALPSDHGLVGWTFDPAPGVFAALLLPAAGLMKVAKVRAMSSVVTNILFHFTVGGASLTNCFAALYTEAGAILGPGAVTADQSTAWQSGGTKICPLVTPMAVTPGAIYRVGWWWNGTTAPTQSRGSNSGSPIVNVNQTASTARFATANSGLTNSAPANLASLAGDSTAWWVGLS